MNLLRLLRIVHLLCWRPLTRDPARTLVTTLGVALGVAVALAIRLANDGVLTTFRSGLDHVTGTTQLEVSSDESGFDETIFPTTVATPGVAAAAPILQAIIPIRGEQRDTLLVLGVDLLGDARFREYRGPTPEVAEPLRLLTDSDAILLTERYARAHGIGVGGQIDLETPTGRARFTVRGLLADQGVARTMDGQVAILDIAAAQIHLGKLGRLDRIDLRLIPGADPEQVAAELRRRLPPEITVQRPEARNARVEQMLGSFQLNLFVLSLIAVFVGAFLVYNTMTISVVRQRRHFGILRSLGLGRRGILLAVAGEGALIGLAGSILGAALGVLLARWALRVVSLTVSSLYAFVRPGELEVPSTTVALAMIVGLGVALAASLAPAVEAARATPREELAPATLDRRGRLRRYTAWGMLLALATLGLVRLEPVGGRPLFGYLAAFTLLLGTILLCPATLRLFQGAVAATLRGTRWIAVRLAAANLGRALRRNGVTVAAMTVALAMLVSVSVMIASFRQTVEVWIDQTIRADLYVSRVSRLLKGADTRLPADLLDRLRQVPGVAEADGFRAIRMQDAVGGQFLLGAGDFDLMARRGRLLFRQGESARVLREARIRGEVVVSETFAERYRLREGDTTTLNPPGRTVQLRIAGVYYDYTTEGGLVVMDRSRFRELWADPWINSILIYLSPGSDLETVRRAVRQASGRDDLALFSNRDLRGRILEIFDQTFAITYALQAIALLVATLGVLTTLAASVLERMREIGILRSIGVSRGGLARMILAEAGWLGLLANAIGTAAGLGLSWILIHVINKQSFGWSIQFSFPGLLLLQYAVLTVGVSLLAAILPAWRASRIAIAEAVRYE